MRMKKICFVTTVSVTLKAFVLKTAEYLHQNGGYDISFICDEDDDFAASLPDYIRFYPIPMKRGISLGGIGAMRKMRKIFKREKFDLVQYSTPNASLYASMAAKSAHIPVRLYCQWGMAYVGFGGIKRKIFKLIEKTVCRLSTWIEPDSYGNLYFCREEGLYSEKKSSVVNKGSASGVSLELFDVTKKTEFRKEIRTSQNIPSDAFVCGFVGRVTRDKGINELLAVIKMLLETHKDIYFLIIGGNDKEDTLDAGLFEWSKRQKQVKYCGATNQVPQYMAAMDCYVMPSYREGFGLTVVEAGAMALPVICTDIPGPTDAISDGVNGVLVKKKNADELAAAILRLYLDRNLAEKLGAAGLENVRENYEQTALFGYILKDRERLLREAENKRK